MPQRGGPTVVARKLAVTFPVDAPPVRLRVVIAEHVLAQGWESVRDQAFEVAERWEGRVQRALLSAATRDLEAGRTTRYEFNPSSPLHIQGSGYVHNGETDPAEIERRARVLNLDEYLRFLRALTPREFEQLCGGVLAVMKAENPQVTPSSKDEGIDFFGRIALSGGDPPFLGSNAYTWLIGQAKHYATSRVATPDLRELVGAIELARGQAFGSRNEEYLGRRIRSCDPVFYLFFTTGEISADGWKLIRSSGIVALDGVALASFLAREGVGTEEDKFTEVAMRTWLANYQHR